jgi:acyl-CoA synthetase (AMP-forming)/AMP-acid ligase II/thioesterase domain-containing protein
LLQTDRYSLTNSDLTVQGLISNWSKRTPDAVAIASPGRSPLSYSDLNSQIEKTVKTLNEFGLGRNDRVAMVLPNGPELAVAFLAVISGATCAPLNPDYRARELDFYLSDLKPKALVFQEGKESAALEIVKKQGITPIRLAPRPEERAGIFSLFAEKSDPATTGGFARAEDIALALHTSGTTARPKIVPLTHSNICTSASSIRETLKLTSSDRCLNIMPLFHIHGLIGGMLSALCAGGSIVCPQGFYAPEFFELMREFQPTWYTAVPTMHQAILARAKQNSEIIRQCKLRFIRSCSSPLPTLLFADLERTFGVPLIESYGMTEASHQIASNLLPPGKRKSGSVGVAAGPEVSVMDNVGKMLPQGEIGEIVIRGPNVTKGYEKNQAANKSSFVNGWFKTGDQGYFDSEGYLTITARFKEIINRGGEKISPREVDEALLDHPSIAQAVTFAVPHPTLGEDVAAAIVLRESQTSTEWEIQKFLSTRLADFKVPRRVVIVDEIPQGPTGKIQRTGLAERLHLVPSVHKESGSRTEYKTPGTLLEKRLVEIWSQVLGVDRVGVSDNFFELGGDSVQAGRIVVRMREAFHIEAVIPLVIFIRAPTIEKMALIISRKEFSLPPASLTALQPGGSKSPLYFVHACAGEVIFLSDLSGHLGPEQPFYGLRAQGLDRNTVPYTRVEDMAAHYLREIQAVQTEGPYFIGGAGVGGMVALEMAQQLRSQGKDVGILFLVDTTLHQPVRRNALGRLAFRLKHEGPLYLTRLPMDFFKFLCVRREDKVSECTQTAVYRYSPRPYTGRIVILMAAEKARPGYADTIVRIGEWQKFAGGRLDAHVLPGRHLGIFKEPGVRLLAQYVRTYLERATSASAGNVRIEQGNLLNDWSGIESEQS